MENFKLIILIVNLFSSINFNIANYLQHLPQNHDIQNYQYETFADYLFKAANNRRNTAHSGKVQFKSEPKPYFTNPTEFKQFIYNYKNQQPQQKIIEQPEHINKNILSNVNNLQHSNSKGNVQEIVFKWSENKKEHKKVMEDLSLQNLLSHKNNILSKVDKLKDKIIKNIYPEKLLIKNKNNIHQLSNKYNPKPEPELGILNSIPLVTIPEHNVLNKLNIYKIPETISEKQNTFYKQIYDNINDLEEKIKNIFTNTFPKKNDNEINHELNVNKINQPYGSTFIKEGEELKESNNEHSEDYKNKENVDLTIELPVYYKNHNKDMIKVKDSQLVFIGDEIDISDSIHKSTVINHELEIVTKKYKSQKDFQHMIKNQDEQKINQNKIPELPNISEDNSSAFHKIQKFITSFKTQKKVTKDLEVKQHSSTSNFKNEDSFEYSISNYDLRNINELNENVTTSKNNEEINSTTDIEISTIKYDEEIETTTEAFNQINYFNNESFEKLYEADVNNTKNDNEIYLTNKKQNAYQYSDSKESKIIKNYPNLKGLGMFENSIEYIEFTTEKVVEPIISTFPTEITTTVINDETTTLEYEFKEEEVLTIKSIAKNYNGSSNENEFETTTYDSPETLTDANIGSNLLKILSSDLNDIESVYLYQTTESPEQIKNISPTVMEELSDYKNEPRTFKSFISNFHNDIYDTIYAQTTESNLKNNINEDKFRLNSEETDLKIVENDENNEENSEFESSDLLKNLNQPSSVLETQSNIKDDEFVQIDVRIPDQHSLEDKDYKLKSDEDKKYPIFPTILEGQIYEHQEPLKYFSENNINSLTSIENPSNQASLDSNKSEIFDFTPKVRTNYNSENTEPISTLNELTDSERETIEKYLRIEQKNNEKSKQKIQNESPRALNHLHLELEIDPSINNVNEGYEMNFINENISDNPDELNEIIQKIIEKLRAGIITDKEKKILSQIFSDFWPLIIEEAERNAEIENEKPTVIKTTYDDENYFSNFNYN